MKFMDKLKGFWDKNPFFFKVAPSILLVLVIVFENLGEVVTVFSIIALLVYIAQAKRVSNELDTRTHDLINTLINKKDEWQEKRNNRDNDLKDDFFEEEEKNVYRTKENDVNTSTEKVVYPEINEVEKNYDKLNSEVDETIDYSVDSVNQQVNQVDETIEHTMDTVDQQVNQVDETIDYTVDSIDYTVDSVDQQVNQVDETIDHSIDELDRQIEEVKQEFKGHEEL